MKNQYDKSTDSLYLHLRNKPSHESEEVLNDVIIDYDDLGAPVGIDIQNASANAELSEMTFNTLSVA